MQENTEHWLTLHEAIVERLVFPFFWFCYDSLVVQRSRNKHHYLQITRGKLAHEAMQSLAIMEDWD